MHYIINKNLKTSMGKAAQEQTVEQLSEDKIAQTLLRQYNNFCNKSEIK